MIDSLKVGDEVSLYKEWIARDGVACSTEQFGKVMDVGKDKVLINLACFGTIEQLWLDPKSLRLIKS